MSRVQYKITRHAKKLKNMIYNKEENQSIEKDRNDKDDNNSRQGL